MNLFSASVLTCIETYLDKDKNYYGSFIIEPLATGQGITLGNSLRRTLLSDLTGTAITGVRINNLKHEFSAVQGVREDILEILLNLKEVVFKSSFMFTRQKRNIKAFIQAKGPLVVTAGMFYLPKDFVKILNPNQYICTIVTEGEFYLEVDLEQGTGYRLTEETNRKNLEQKFSPGLPNTLLMDAVFGPIKSVNYKIKLIHDTQGNIKESLFLEILTNGSITPKRGLQEAVKILLNLFYPLFITPNFLTVNSEIAKFAEKNFWQNLNFKKNA
jgi:DNA-directed RNA polymerase subunit alpha